MAINFGNNQRPNIWEQLLSNTSGMAQPATNRMRQLGSMLGGLMLPNKGQNLGNNFNKLFRPRVAQANQAINEGVTYDPETGEKTGGILDIVRGLRGEAAGGEGIEYDPMTGQPQISQTNQAPPKSRNQMAWDMISSPFKNIYNAMTYDLTEQPGYNPETGEYNPVEGNAGIGGALGENLNSQQRTYYHPKTGQQVSKKYYDTFLSNNQQPTGTVGEQLWAKYGKRPPRPEIGFVDDDTTDQEFEEAARNYGVENYSDAQLQGLADLEAQGADIYGTGEVEEDPYMIENYEAQPEFQGPPMPPAPAPVIDAFDNLFAQGETSATPDAEFEGDDMRAMAEINNQALQDYVNNPFMRNNPMFQNIVKNQATESPFNPDNTNSMINNLLGGGPPLGDEMISNITNSMDDISDEEFRVAQTALGEGRGEGNQGLQAILETMLNRQGTKGDTLSDVVNMPYQYSVNNPEEANSANTKFVNALTKGSKNVQDVVKLLRGLQSGDIERMLPGDTMHYFNPSLVSPNWATNAPADSIYNVGQHRFIRGIR